MPDRSPEAPSGPQERPNTIPRPHDARAATRAQSGPWCEAGLLVLAERCSTCIFRPGDLMHLRPGRVAGMVRECRRTGSFVPCHETLAYDDDETSSGPICRGFYDAHGDGAQLVQVARRLGHPIVEVPAP